MIKGPRIQLMLVLLATLAALAWAPSAAARTSNKADLVVVKKAQRTLELLHQGRIIRSFEISLGENPLGHKRRQGDGRTPEGRYTLDWRNPNSRFYKSIHISYPNADDVRRAREAGAAPGGHIMIHGLPNKFAKAPELFEGLDWTEGCIAVTNQDIEEIWNLVADNTPIEIYP